MRSTTVPASRTSRPRLYRGEANVNVVGKRKWFYGVAAILLIAIGSFVAPPVLPRHRLQGRQLVQLPDRASERWPSVRATFTENGANVASAQEFGNASKQYVIKTAVLDTDPSIAAKKSNAITDAVASKTTLHRDRSVRPRSAAPGAPRSPGRPCRPRSSSSSSR